MAMYIKKKKDVDIIDLYSLKSGSIWRALKAEHASLWMLNIYFLFEYVRPQGIYPALDILPWAQIFLFLTLVAAFMDKTVKVISNVENRLFVLFSFIVLLSSIFAFNPAYSLDYWSVFTGWFIVYFLVISIVNTEKRLFLFLLLYCLYNFKMSQHGTTVFAQRGFSFADYGINGAPGWFRNSGEYAVQMLISGSLIISIVIGLKDYWGKYKRWLMYAVASTGYLAVMGASSRGSQVALAAIGIWLLLKQKNGVKGLIALAIFAILLFNILPDKQMERFEEMGEDENSVQRLAYWEYGIKEVIPKHPVLGVGYHNWLAYLNFAAPEGMGPMQRNQESHNIFIQATSELGFVGLIGFVLLIVYGFVNNTRTRSMAKTIDNKFLFILTYGFDAGLIGFLVAGFFVTILYYPFFWVQIAMITMLNGITAKQYAEQV